LFKGIHRLLPGHRLVHENGRIAIAQYWDVPTGEPSTVADRERIGRFRELLEESVRLRLMADVPLGVFLSGGIDSSAIAALVATMVDRPLQTFSVAFKDRAFSELAYARTVARAIKAEAHEVVVDERDFFGALPRLIWHEDEPIAHPSSVPLYFVSKLARDRVKVVLTGEGADELLAGYGKYPRIAWNWRAGTIYQKLVPHAARRAISSRVLPMLRGRLGRYARRSFLGMERTAEAMCFDNFASIRLRDQQRLLSPAQRAAFRSHAYASSVAYFDYPNGRSTLLDRMLYADIKTYLVELLMKQDQMSMAASIESRVPFLDHHLVEFAATLPDEWKLSGWTGKRVLREAMQGVIPEAVLTRPKMGFPVPFTAWTRGAWSDVAREVLLDKRTRERGILDVVAVDELFREHGRGMIDAGERIWMLLNLELWYRTFIDGEGIQTLPGPHHVTRHRAPLPSLEAEALPHHHAAAGPVP
jgi:asparagine synthase (glutamine-hydrolysing)